MFIAALFLISKGETTKCLWNDEWIKKMCYTYPMEYYLAVKKNEVLIHATAGVNPENIMPSGKSPS